ncbi:MAG: hypothetical protein D6766_08015, partial [Verrucomicrobia bacterium]
MSGLRRKRTASREKTAESKRRRPQEGFVLLTVLIIVMLSSMVAVSLLYSTRAEATAQAATLQGQQAWAAMWSGVWRAAALAQASVATEEWREAADALRHQEIVDDGAERWFFTVWSEADGEGEEVRFGLSDEASRLNVRTAPAEWLAALSPESEGDPTGPGAFGEEEPPSGGTSLFPGAVPESDSSGEAAGDMGPAAGEETTNVPPAGVLREGTVPAWLAGQGYGPELLAGEDANENLRLDPNEDDGGERWPPDDQDGRLDAGWQRLLTDASYEPNVDAGGRPRVNLNDPDAVAGARDLPRETVRYLEALQRAGRRLNHVAELLEAEMDLPDSRGGSRRLRSGIGAEQLPDLLDRYTATDQPVLRGLIN